MTEASNPRPTLFENITLVITVVSGVRMTTKWLDPVLSFALWGFGYSIVIAFGKTSARPYWRKWRSLSFSL